MRPKGNELYIYLEYLYNFKIGLGEVEIQAIAKVGEKMVDRKGVDIIQ